MPTQTPRSRIEGSKARRASLALLALLALVLSSGCASSGFTISRAEKRWSESVGESQKGKTILDLERSLRRGQDRTEGGSEIAKLERQFAGSMEGRARAVSVARADRNLTADTSHHEYLRENSIAGLSRKLDRAQGR